MSLDAQALAKMPFFQHLDPGERSRVATFFHEQSYVPGQAVVNQGEAGHSVYFVSRGTLRTRRVSVEGREHVLSYLGPGSCVGLVAALDQGVHGSTVDAVVPSTLLAITAQDFRSILTQYHSVSLAVAEHLAREVRHLRETVEDLALRTVRARLARFLITRISEPSGPKRWTQEDIASYIGTVREMVARILRAMAAEGLIRRESGRIVIVDRAGLEREAGGQF